jgi:hypothetical protein
MTAKLAIRLELCGKAPIEDAAATAIMLAGRMNAPVVFKFGGVDVTAGTSDAVKDVVERYEAAAAEAAR